MNTISKAEKSSEHKPISDRQKPKVYRTQNVVMEVWDAAGAVAGIGFGASILAAIPLMSLYAAGMGATLGIEKIQSMLPTTKGSEALLTAMHTMSHDDSAKKIGLGFKITLADGQEKNLRDLSESDWKTITNSRHNFNIRPVSPDEKHLSYVQWDQVGVPYIDHHLLGDRVEICQFEVTPEFMQAAHMLTEIATRSSNIPEEESKEMVQKVCNQLDHPGIRNISAAQVVQAVHHVTVSAKNISLHMAPDGKISEPDSKGIVAPNDLRRQ